MQGRIFFAALVPLVVVFGCSKLPAENVPEKVKSVASAESATDCAPDYAYRPPALGVSFTYELRNTDGAAIAEKRQTVVKVVGDGIVEVGSSDVIGAGRFSSPEPVFKRFGILPIRHDIKRDPEARDHEYDVTKASRLIDLSVGQTVSIPGKERTAYDGKARSVSGDHIITLERCAKLRVGNRDYPVRVYRFQSFGRSFSTAQAKDDIRKSDTKVYLSEEMGWPLKIESSGKSALVVTAVQGL